MNAILPKAATTSILCFFVLISSLESVRPTCRGDVIYKFVNKQSGLVTGTFAFDDPAILGTSNWSLADGNVLSSILAGGISGISADFGGGFETATGGDLTVTTAFGSTTNGRLIDFGIIGNTGSGPITFASGYSILSYAFNNGSSDVVTVGVPGVGSINVLGEFRLMPVLVGDANGDCVVGAADYALWAAQFGRTGLDLTADYDCNGSVGAGDYALWAANFGNTCSLPSESSVPEPASLALASLGMIFLLAQKRWRYCGRTTCSLTA